MSHDRLMGIYAPYPDHFKICNIFSHEGPSAAVVDLAYGKDSHQS